MEMEKYRVLIQLLVIFRQFGDVLSFLYARRLRGYTATGIIYYIADLPVTRLRLLTNKSDNIAVPYASLRSLILLLSSIELRLFSPIHESVYI